MVEYRDVMSGIYSQTRRRVSPVPRSGSGHLHTSRYRVGRSRRESSSSADSLNGIDDLTNLEEVEVPLQKTLLQIHRCLDRATWVAVAQSRGDGLNEAFSQLALTGE